LVDLVRRLDVAQADVAETLRTWRSFAGPKERVRKVDTPSEKLIQTIAELFPEAHVHRFGGGAAGGFGLLGGILFLQRHRTC